MYKAIHENVDDYYTKYRLKNREFIFNYLKPYFLEYANSWNYSDVHMKIMWFIQYENNNQQNQGWHGHDYTSLSSVYLLELSDSEQATEFWGIDVGELKEGDLIIFPSFIPHRSPDVLNGRKTAIGVDINMSGCIL